ncbi:MAG: LysE family transporter, partial [Chloroflexi bacterium]|nr:LysE family transporter [Chloroflexota bacterium]
TEHISTIVLLRSSEKCQTYYPSIMIEEISVLCYTHGMLDITPSIPLIFSTSFVVGFSGAMMPGSLLALTVGEVTRRGFWASPLLIVGHSILEGIFIIILVSGLSQIIDNNTIKGSVGLAGGIIMLIMGYSMVRSGIRKIKLLDGPTSTGHHSSVIILSGALGSISNPYWFIWWITIGTTYLLWSLNQGIAGILSFYTGHILSDFLWYAIIAFILVSGKKIIKDRLYRWLLVVCGIFLSGFGGYFIATGISFFTNNL